MLLPNPFSLSCQVSFFFLVEVFSAVAFWEEAPNTLPPPSSAPSRRPSPVPARATPAPAAVARPAGEASAERESRIFPDSSFRDTPIGS